MGTDVSLQSQNDTPYTIDELSAKTGVPSRTIRFYQAKGALQAPARKGRVAYYNEEHIKRLELVADLQDRGLSLRVIRDLVHQVQNGDVSLNEWLGLEEKLQASWADDEPRLISEAELRQLIGPAVRPGLIAELENVELIRREGASRPASYFVQSLATLQIAIKLDANGVDLKTTKMAGEVMRKHLGRLADELSSHFQHRLLGDAGLSRLDTEQLGRSIETLRAIWFEATRVILAQEIERAVRETVEKGDFLRKGTRHRHMRLGKGARSKR